MTHALAYRPDDDASLWAAIGLRELSIQLAFLRGKRETSAPPAFGMDNVVRLATIKHQAQTPHP